jgi:iron complex outermembrane receptor protein
MKKVFLVLCIGAALQTAFAQEKPAADNEAGESLDFVVTAGRTPEDANKVAGQVTVITAEDIAESGATNVTELLQMVPGIRIARDKSGGSVDISMRGISSDNGRGKVLIIVDGMRINPVVGRSVLNWDTINLSDVERIEVLDGGASVQYGDNASVGVINIITKKSGAAKTDIAVSFGSFFQNEQRFSHHRPTDWGGFTVSGGHQGTQGYQKHSASDAGNGELRGFIDLNDAMSLQANVGFGVKNALFANGLTKAEFDDDPTQNKGSSGINVSSSSIIAGMGFAWVINDTLSLDVPVTYNFTTTKMYYPTSSMGYDLPHQMLGVRPKINVELKPADMNLRFTGGVDTLFAFGEVKTTYDLVKETNPMVQTVSEFTLGPWVLVNFEPLPLLSLNAGLRYDTAFVKAQMDDWSGTVPVPGVGAVPMSFASGDESTNWDSFVYEAGVTVNPFDFLKVYAKYGTQFKYPYLDDIIVMSYGPGETIGLNTDLKPEKGWTVEGGIGLNIKNILRLDANLYYLKIDNEILTVLTSPTATSTINLDPIGRLGTDIGLKLTPVKYLSMDVDYSFVNAEFSEGNYEGKTVPLVAAHTLSGSLIFHLPFGLSLGPDILYKSEIYPAFDNDNTSPVDASCIWGVRARYTPTKFDGNLAVLLTVHNLLDTQYASFVNYLGGTTTYFVDNNMGRSVNVSVQYRF